MSNVLLKLTIDEPILPQYKQKNNPIKKLFTNFINHYDRLNRWFGIQDSKSDQVWYYGTLFLMVFLPSVTYILSKFYFGF